MLPRLHTLVLRAPKYLSLIKYLERVYWSLDVQINYLPYYKSGPRLPLQRGFFSFTCSSEMTDEKKSPSDPQFSKITISDSSRIYKDLGGRHDKQWSAELKMSAAASSTGSLTRVCLPGSYSSLSNQCFKNNDHFELRKCFQIVKTMNDKPKSAKSPVLLVLLRWLYFFTYAFSIQIMRYLWV